MKGLRKRFGAWLKERYLRVTTPPPEPPDLTGAQLAAFEVGMRDYNEGRQFVPPVRPENAEAYKLGYEHAMFIASPW